MKLLKSFGALVLTVLSTPGLLAGATDLRVETALHPLTSNARFARGRMELSLVNGALVSPVNLGGSLFPRTKTSFAYTETEARFGIMLHSPWEAGILRGNFEALLGLGGGAVLRGPGHGLANGDLFFRYNFVQPHAMIVPYWQVGLGLLASDVARDHNQRIIGRTVEFSIQSGVGLRLLLNERWSVELEGVYQHISNADTAQRNVGVNALGGLLGLTFSL